MKSLIKSPWFWITVVAVAGVVIYAVTEYKKTSK